jgi:outer membrane protein
MKRIFIIPLILVAANSFAQTSSLSLNDALKIAVTNRYELKIQKANTAISQKQSQEVTTRFLPQITSDLDVRYNTKLQTNVLPGTLFNSTEDKRIQMGTTYNTLWGFNLNQTIFNPTNIQDKKIADLQVAFQKHNETITEINIKQEVTEAYFAVLLWKERLKLSEKNLTKTEELYQVAVNQRSQGRATVYDVQRTNIDIENAKATHEQNKKSYQLAISDLLYKMDSKDVPDLVLTDSITNLAQEYTQTLSGNQAVNRTELTQQKIQIDINNQNAKKQNWGWMPTLSLYANYSLQYLNNKFSPFGSDNWYPYNYLGIKASFPIFDGGLKSRTKQEYQLRTEAAKIQYDKLQKDYNQEVTNTRTTLDNSLSDLNYQKKNLELIEELYKIDTERFKNGAIKQSDLSTTNYTLQQTQTNYINAVYSYLIAVVRYKKANGTL